MVDGQGRDRASNETNEHGDAPTDEQPTQRFVPRSPLEDLPIRPTPPVPNPVPPVEDETVVPSSSENEAADVISLPAHSEDLVDEAPGAQVADASASPGAAEPAAGAAAARVVEMTEVPIKPAGEAANWLDRIRTATHRSPEPAGESNESAGGDEGTLSTLADPADPVESDIEAETDTTPSSSANTAEETPADLGEPTETIVTLGPDDDRQRADTVNLESIVCPVCGHHTDALRFCGYCGSRLGATSRSPGKGNPRLEKIHDRIRTFIDPTWSVASTLPHAVTLGIGLVLVMISLLSNSGGMALVVTCAIVPVLILLSLNQRDVFESESPLVLLATAGAGGVAGIIVAWLGATFVSAGWFDTGVLNFGAAGFGGRFAEGAGAAPFLVWLTNGILLPLAGLAGIVAAPIALRRFNRYRNEVMDGTILAGAGGAGFAIGSAIVFWAPIFDHRGPSIDVSDWTLTVIGMAILRPIVITLAGAMLGAGVWRYMKTPQRRVLILPAAGSIGGMILLYLGSLWIQPSGGGLWPEVLWLGLIAVAVFILYKLVLTSAITEDRKAFGTDDTRIVCPHCHRMTLEGAFCSRCGKPLPEDSSTTVGATTT